MHTNVLNTYFNLDTNSFIMMGGLETITHKKLVPRLLAFGSSLKLKLKLKRLSSCFVPSHVSMMISPALPLP